MISDHIQGVPVQRVLLRGIMINLRPIVNGLHLAAAREVWVKVECTHRGKHQTQKEKP